MVRRAPELRNDSNSPVRLGGLPGCAAIGSVQGDPGPPLCLNQQASRYCPDMDLRPGIILTVTGIIAMVVVLLPSRPNRTLSRRTGVIIAIVLLVVGIPLLVVGILSH